MINKKHVEEPLNQNFLHKIQDHTFRGWISQHSHAFELNSKCQTSDKKSSPRPFCWTMFKNLKTAGLKGPIQSFLISASCDREQTWALIKLSNSLSTRAQLRWQTCCTCYGLSFCYIEHGSKLSSTHSKFHPNISWKQPDQPTLRNLPSMDFQLFPKLILKLLLISLYNFKIFLSMKWN